MVRGVHFALETLDWSHMNAAFWQIGGSQAFENMERCTQETLHTISLSQGDAAVVKRKVTLDPQSTTSSSWQVTWTQQNGQFVS